jgi:glycosyltransferase involved in cell wall biosynthesis
MDMAARLGLSNVEFQPRVPFETLPTYIAEADIVLGVFGDTPQADKAMANKVLQGLAMKKPVVSGDTRSVRENFRHGEHLWLCQLGDAQALASALGTLADPELRHLLAEEGYRQVMARLTPAVVGKSLYAELAGLIERRR